MCSLTADDALIDTEDWVFNLSITDPDTGAPLDLTGSDFKLTLVSGVDGAVIGTAAPGSGLTVLTPASGGVVRVSFPARTRTWRAPRQDSFTYWQPVPVFGDLIRKPVDEVDYRVEALQRIRLYVRPGTTQWTPTSP